MKRTKQSTFAKRERSEKSTGFAPVGGEDMTHTAKHTPGPWFYNYDDRCITNQDGVTVINVHGAMSGDNTNADIAMLAAAPAMYEALKDAIDTIAHMRHYYAGRKLSEEDIQKIVDTSRTALAQAEGGGHE